MTKLFLVLGGVRSGKSRFAEQLARELAGDDVLYVATAQIGDEEMEQRVQRHREQRSATWRTLEASQQVGAAIRAVADAPAIILVDCLTVLVSNLLLAASPPSDTYADPEDDPFNAEIESEIMAEAAALVACAKQGNADMIIVSNEVGTGIVPPYALGRAYRDLVGFANQELARQADEVHLLVAGIPLHIK